MSGHIRESRFYSQEKKQVKKMQAIYSQQENSNYTQRKNVKQFIKANVIQQENYRGYRHTDHLH